MNIFNYFNSMYARPNQRNQLNYALNNVRKSMLSTDVTSGEGLIPERLRKAITNTVLQLVPELNLPVHTYETGKRFQYNKLTKLPAPGAAMGEMSITPTTSSTTTRSYVDLKVIKRKGAVTGFMKATSVNYIDPNTYEMENQLQSFGLDMRTYMLYGNALADTYTPTGITNFISTNRYNLTGADQVQTTLERLDAAIDAGTAIMAKDHKKCFLISPQLLSALSRLVTTVRDTRTLNEVKASPLVGGGYILESYRNVPFVETTATRPVWKVTGTTELMGTVTLSAAGAGSGIPDNTYYFRVAPVTWRGEQIASTSNNSITTSSNDSITLAFSDVTDSDGVSVALMYYVYCSTTKDAEKLVKIVPAFTYDGVGTPTGKITSISFTSNPTVAHSSVPSHMQSDLPLDRDPASKEPAEVIALWDLDEVQGLGNLAYTNDDGSRLEGLVTMEDLAKVEDYKQFLLKCYFAMADSWERTSTFIKGIRTK